MSLLTRGTNKLSQLEIDISKDWAGHLIKNIGPATEDADALRKAEAVLQAVMTTRGDIIFRGDSGAQRLAPDAGKGYNFLRSRGPGLSPVWQDIEGLIQFMTAALNRAVAFDLALPVPGVSQVSQQASSPPGRTASPALSVPEPSVSIVTETGDGGGVAATPSLNVPVAVVSKEVAIGEPVGGAIADDSGVQTNETAQANNDTANDMTLLPAVPAVNDAYYFGHSSLWDWLELRIGTAGNGIWTIAWEYWNGATWAALPSVNDGTSSFTVSGNRLVTFSRPADWVPTTVGGITNLYWVRARVSAYTSIVTQPKGNRAFIWIKC
jgi:hypothetical protein